ncbi:hypothetical protein ACFVTC_42590 [Streptomyces sp. NPDC057950]|uniref:hypothetical protein n=1 Tax=Streptomyces sp. NPDC057950 TaxID=3346288 RepID=UPI0036E3A841
MAAFLYARLATDHEYVQRVRQQRPSTLLPVIGAASARWHSDTWWNSPFRKYTPWALADVARTSIAHGNEYRGDGNCTENDLVAMLAAYAALTDPMIRDSGTAESVAGWLLRTSGEQFTHQELGFNDLARTAALLEQTSPAHTPRCLVDGWDEEPRLSLVRLRRRHSASAGSRAAERRPLRSRMAQPPGRHNDADGLGNDPAPAYQAA